MDHNYLIPICKLSNGSNADCKEALIMLIIIYKHHGYVVKESDNFVFYISVISCAALFQFLISHLYKHYKYLRRRYLIEYLHLFDLIPLRETSFFLTLTPVVAPVNTGNLNCHYHQYTRPNINLPSLKRSV